MIFLRHPRPGVAPGVCYGRLDLPLAGTAAEEIAAALQETPRVSHVIASPAGRCRLLAEELAARDGTGLTLDARLWELDFGRWEGQSWDTLPRPETDHWAEDPWHRAPPGGESFADLHARVAAVLADAGPGTAFVCHAGPIRAARMLLTGARFDTVFAEPVPYARPIRFTREAV